MVTSKKGFTLIELMIVVAIIAILAAVTYPSYQSAVIKTKRANGWATMMQLMQQQERYYSQNNAYLAFASTDSPSSGFKTFSGDSAASSPYLIKGEVCTGDTIANCVLLTATQVSPFSDPKCGDLMLDSTGQRSVSVTGAKDCW
jgi:type IV pilus assembly protein PilE